MIREFTWILLLLLATYLLVAALLYLFQRSMIYFPTPPDETFGAREIRLENQAVSLHGWVLNPGKARGLLYFGGNAESITGNQQLFTEILPDYSVYLIEYRGYGLSQGQPSEAALFADALFLYDQLAPVHESLSAYGRSLGSGVAVYLAAHRRLHKLVLLTPYDSVVAVAQRAYPIFPARLLLKDRFDSAALAPGIKLPVLIAAATRDRVIPPAHALALKAAFTRAAVHYVEIDGAAHNDIVDFPAYRDALRVFMSE